VRQHEWAHLFIEPDILHAGTVEDAVDHDREALDVRLPAGGAAIEKDDRPCPVLGEDPLDPRRMLATTSRASTGSLSWKRRPSRSFSVQVNPSASTVWPSTICGCAFHSPSMP